MPSTRPRPRCGGCTPRPTLAVCRSCRAAGPGRSPRPWPENDGLSVEADVRWEARWRLRHSVELDRAIASLGDQAPPALWAPFAGGAPPGAVRAVVEYFADGAARWALETGGWNPDLGRSSRADVVVARRIAAALRGERRCSTPTVTSGRRRAPPVWPSMSTGSRSMPDSAFAAEPGSGHRTHRRRPDRRQRRRRIDAARVERLRRGGSPSRWCWSTTRRSRSRGRTSPLGSSSPATTQGGVEVPRPRLSSSRSTSTRWPSTWPPRSGVRRAEPRERRGAARPRRRHQAVGRWRRTLCSTRVRAARSEGVGSARVHLAGKARSSRTAGLSADLGQTMVDVDWAIALGEQRLTDAEIAALAESKSQLVQLRGAWVRVDAGHVASALDHLASAARARP